MVNRQAHLTRTLEQVENDRWGDPPADATNLVATVHRLRCMPIGALTVENLRMLIGQVVGTNTLVPLALALLEHDPLAEGDFYPGDLLDAVCRRTPRSYWSANPQHLARLKKVVAALASTDTDTDEYVVDIAAIRAHLSQ